MHSWCGILKINNLLKLNFRSLRPWASLTALFLERMRPCLLVFLSRGIATRKFNQRQIKDDLEKNRCAAVLWIFAVSFSIWRKSCLNLEIFSLSKNWYLPAQHGFYKCIKNSHPPIPKRLYMTTITVCVLCSDLLTRCTQQYNVIISNSQRSLAPIL